MEGRLLIRSAPRVILSIEFSPPAVRLDEFASTFEKGSFLNCLFSNGARIISLIVPHTTVDLVIEDSEVSTASTRTSRTIAETTVELHRRLLRGQSVAAGITYIVLLLWGFNNSRGMMEVLTGINRYFPTCRLALDQAINIPMAYALYRKSAYMPEPDLLKIRK